jgi:hypothetical protein
MANLNNKIPLTIKIAEVPLSTPFLEKGIMSSIWNKWFSQIGTWIIRSQENKTGEFTYNNSVIGEYRANRSGNIVVINGSINAGTYSNIIVTGIPVHPLVDIPILVSNGNGYINTNGEFILNCTSESKILISASYIAMAPKEN